MVFDGIRQKEEQEEFVRTGASKTMLSMHLRQDDGFGHAVDLVPFIAGRPRWELAPCCEIAASMRQAAEELGVNVKWGGAWTLLNGSGPIGDPETLVGMYVARKLRAGKRFFIDGPHYELLAGG